MKNKDKLIECFNLAIQINEYLDCVFIRTAPHINMVEFDFHLNGWNRKGSLDVSVQIYTDNDYKDYDIRLPDNKGINDIDTLLTYMNNLLNDLRVANLKENE